ILAPITTTQIEQASARIRGSVLRTPIVRLNIDSDMEIYLKLENLQPTGSFKVRGACNAIALAGPAAKSRGVYTCSAGNMAQALAWQAGQNGIPERKPTTRVYAVEPETAAPLAASFSSGRAMEVNRVPSFVDGIGGKSVLPEMWDMVRPLIQGSIVCPLKEIASAIRLLVERNRIVAEGGGAASVAAALTGKAGKGKIVCVVSGGNIDTAKLETILSGKVP